MGASRSIDDNDEGERRVIIVSQTRFKRVSIVNPVLAPKTN